MRKKLQDFVAGKTKQESILTALAKGSSDKTYPNFENFAQVIKDLLGEFKLTPANVNALALAMSEMDKTAEVIRTKRKDKPNEIADGIVYDKTTKDSEIVKMTEDVETYFAREVYPHVPDAHYWFDEEKGYGAEIPFYPLFLSLPSTRKCRQALGRVL